MDTILEKLPRPLSTYLTNLMTEEGFTESNKRRRFVKNWLKKRAIFDKIVEHNGFTIVDRIGVDCRNGILVITYSGSILTVSGEKPNKTRDLVYESIKLRSDNYPKTEEQSITIDLPVELNKPVNVNGGKLVKTSPVFSLAVEKENKEPSFDVIKRFDHIREKISEALISINKAIFSKEDNLSLENRDDLFKQWTVLSWFKTGGWKAELYLIRANLLWLELFTGVYGEIIKNITAKENQDKAFLDMTNKRFTEYCDVYKWLESEKKDFDIGLMKALEEIPSREDYQIFVNRETEGLLREYK